VIGATGKLIWLFFSNNTIDYSSYFDEDAYINSYTDTNSNNLTDEGEIVSLTISHPNYGVNFDSEDCFDWFKGKETGEILIFMSLKKALEECGAIVLVTREAIK
jgi:hypothetical protein